MFRVVPLSEKDGDVFDLAFLRPPSYAGPEDAVTLGEARSPEKREVGEVPGLFTLDPVLTPEECAQFMEIADTIGYTASCGIGPATKDGKVPPKCVYVAPVKLVEAIYERIAHAMPSLEGYQPVGLNPRFRMHSYGPGYILGPHYDRGGYTGSAVDDDGELRFDHYKDGRISKMSCLIYLDGSCTGGETRFFPRNADPILLAPKRGSASFFFHGDHPESPLHEGCLVTAGSKSIIRTDVLFRPE